MQKQLGKDAELSAAEIVRRAERCIGLAIRGGQEEGTIGRRKDNRYTLRNGHTGVVKTSPTEYASGDELNGNGRQPGLYSMADDVTDEQFEEARDDPAPGRDTERGLVSTPRRRSP